MVSKCPGTMYRFFCGEMTQHPGPHANSRSRPDSTLEGVDAMGRGRQKAKQTKVARELKYYSPQTNYAQLERELGGQSALDTKNVRPRVSREPWDGDDDEETPR